MADKLLKSIKFPTLPDRYVIGDSTLTEEGAAAEAKSVGEALATKADTKGRYEDLIAGGAEQLMSDEYESDTEPYLFRPTGGSADVGNREYLDSIVGGTVAWNQLAIAYERTHGSGVVISRGEYGEAVLNGTASYSDESASITTIAQIISNHRYFFWGVSEHPVRMVTFASPTVFSITTSQTFGITTPIVSGTTYSNVHIPCLLIDLTAMFGTTIADYIYSLEQAHAGAGVAWFRNYFPKDYYPYDPGTLRSVEGVSAHETVGFNQWDEEWEVGYLDPSTGNNASSNDCIRSKNYNAVLPNTSYYVRVPSGSGVDCKLYFYDGNKGFISRTTKLNEAFTTPSNARYLRFYMSNQYSTTYNNDICVNISDPSRNGEYEPYQKHTYPLDSSLTLRGIPKLVDGKLVFDGDIYPPSGDVQRRYGLRAYQSGDESLADAITDGTNTVYKLATPTTETADGYEHYQICDTSGTEEFVTTGIVPVGHETRYPHDLKKKVETAPDSPSTDGTYLMKRSGGKNTYMALPSTPSANGAYVLTVTVSGGSASYSWAAKE